MGRFVPPHGTNYLSAMKLRQPISNGRGHDNGNKWYWIHKNDVDAQKQRLHTLKKRAAYTNHQADFQTDK